MNSFSILPGHSSSPVILHVPHASRTIPPHVRAKLLLDDAALDAELDEATDTDTDLIATLGADHARTHPWIVKNALSRLVVDPERFPDASEPATAFGRGAVYTRACDGRRLRVNYSPTLTRSSTSTSVRTPWLSPSLSPTASSHADEQ